ncbi:hypothetical protein L873DRAFT_1906914 [Choiromyces venosus 120613-1]|uniref:HTH CENPB-type domain-containing protein n=1 Tax=Choiromyces venosus 120613-1 TaxID=1336337 RepID=A0A3N4K053_9PEZI|nr:hypothetical protein L873DRAFT_1906914 [Choiromyces venosus 120613-1]
MIARWNLPDVRDRILHQSGELSRHDTSTTFVCMWLEMEKMLWEAFVVWREQGRPARDGWFRRKAKELWKTAYPDLQHMPALFVFSLGWFHGFLARHRIVLEFVTNTAQSLPENYKQQILQWLQFNRWNRILTQLVPVPRWPSPLSLHYICHDNQGGIPEHRIYNVDETPLPWEYLIGRTYDLKGAKTVWSKSAESGSEKCQCTLFLCIFADGIPWVPPILIFTATTGTKIQEKEGHLWDKHVHVEFSPSGWMNETIFRKFILQFLVPIFGNEQALFVFDHYRAHLTPSVIQTC